MVPIRSAHSVAGGDGGNGAENATIRIELALLSKGDTLRSALTSAGEALHPKARERPGQS